MSTWSLVFRPCEHTRTSQNQADGNPQYIYHINIDRAQAYSSVFSGARIIFVLGCVQYVLSVVLCKLMFALANDMHFWINLWTAYLISIIFLTVLGFRLGFKLGFKFSLQTIIWFQNFNSRNYKNWLTWYGLEKWTSVGRRHTTFGHLFKTNNTKH